MLSDDLFGVAGWLRGNHDLSDLGARAWLINHLVMAAADARALERQVVPVAARGEVVESDQVISLDRARHRRLAAVNAEPSGAA